MPGSTFLSQWSVEQVVNAGLSERSIDPVVSIAQRGVLEIQMFQLPEGLDGDDEDPVAPRKFLDLASSEQEVGQCPAVPAIPNPSPPFRDGSEILFGPQERKRQETAPGSQVGVGGNPVGRPENSLKQEPVGGGDNTLRLIVQRPDQVILFQPVLIARDLPASDSSGGHEGYMSNPLGGESQPDQIPQFSHVRLLVDHACEIDVEPGF